MKNPQQPSRRAKSLFSLENTDSDKYCSEVPLKLQNLNGLKCQARVPRYITVPGGLMLNRFTTRKKLKNSKQSFKPRNWGSEVISDKHNQIMLT